MEEKKFTKEELHKKAYELYQFEFLKKKALEGKECWSLYDLFTDIVCCTMEYDLFTNIACCTMEDDNGNPEYEDWFKKSEFTKEMHTPKQFMNIEYQNRKYIADLLKPYPELAYAYIMDLTDIDLGRKDN